jgi:hypothetical protein
MEKHSAMILLICDPELEDVKYCDPPQGSHNVSNESLIENSSPSQQKPHLIPPKPAITEQIINQGLILGDVVILHYFGIETQNIVIIILAMEAIAILRFQLKGGRI